MTRSSSRRRSGGAPSLRRRASGALLHVTSLPGGHGVGDLGPQARAFADWLAEAGQTWWQMLPVCPIGAANSPYSSPSAFAGNPLLVSLEALVEDGLLEPSDLEGAPPAGERVDYDAAWRFKEPRLRKASASAAQSLEGPVWDAFKSFYNEHAVWLDDYAQFMALKERFGTAAWVEWPPAVRQRRFREWEPGLLKSVGEAAFHHQFVQFLFHRQWRALREHCRAKGLGLIGDVPIFVSHESVDVWAHQDLFQLGPDGRPTVVAGVPPDYFSATGQRWGNPHYRWDVLAQRGYAWWLARLRSAAERFDAVRLDHFIGFQRYWEIPASCPTAVEGRWLPGPDGPFFETATRELPQLELIAEDLGSITPEVAALRDRFHFPGMRVLQFAFGSDQQAESFLPHNYPRRCVAYTGTHDNDTTRGWYEESSTELERHRARVYLRSDGSQIHWDMIACLLRSTADTAIFPAQDLLGLGSAARMNKPGTAQGNWEWRLAAGALTPELARRLRELAREGGRPAPISQQEER